MKKLLFILVVLFITGCCDILCERHAYALEIIVKVEKFKEQNGRLPSNEKELKMEFPEHLSFYTKKSDDEYEVWYGTDLGTSKIYNSKTKTWIEAG